MEYTFKQRDFEQTNVFVRIRADDLVNIVTTFREFLMGCGFHPNSVDEYVPDPFGGSEVDLDTEQCEIYAKEPEL